MNLRSANSGGPATSPPPPAAIELEILLPDGSCIPATRSNARRVFKQARSAMLKARKARRNEIAAELQQNLEDRRAARGLLNELAGYERDRRRMAAVLRAKVRPEVASQQTSSIQKRSIPFRSSVVIVAKPGSSWVLDDRGMRGVAYHQSYLSRKSSSFYRGAASDRWLYDVRDEAVVRDADDNVIWFSNLGDDIDEIAAAWQAVEDATTRGNGKIQIHIIVPLDADASPGEQAAALRHFCEHVLKPLDLPYSAVMHHAPEGGDQRNVHGHILTNLRPIDRIAPYTWAFADEIRGELDGKNGVQMLRHLWAHSASEAAEQFSRDMRYTGLSYAARGLPLEAGEHLGEARAAMVARGEGVWAHERNRIKSARNAQRMILLDLDRKMAALTAVRDTLVADRQRATRLAQQPALAPTGSAIAPTLRAAVNRTSNRASALVRAAIDAVSAPSRLDTAVSGSAKTVPFKLLRSSGPTTQASSVPRLVSFKVQPRPSRVPSDAREVAPPSSAARPALVPSTATSTSKVAGRTFLTRATARASVGQTMPAVLTSAVVDRDSRPPPAIVETMRELLERIEMRQSTRPRDAATAAWLRRRILANKAAAADANPKSVATRLWFELNPLEPNTPAARQRAVARDRERLKRITAGRGYVTEKPNGILIQAIRTGSMPAPDQEWWEQDHIQRPLADLRRRQQEVMERALTQSRLATDQITATTLLRWTIDVSVEDRDRLRRWAEAPTFSTDLINLSRRMAKPPVGGNDQATLIEPAAQGAGANRIPDGFGGWRDMGPPVYIGAEQMLRLAPFDAPGKPSTPLLRLLHLASQHPGVIAVATDGRLMVESKAPAMLAPLLHGWRDDPAVAPLVWETVRLSRSAGRPAWPSDIAVAVRAFASREAGTVSRPPPRDPLHDWDIS